jgi:predicted CoA-binding protein
LRILRSYKHVAIVGISANQYRPSHFVAIYLQAEGYDIILVNPNYAGQILLGKRVYATLTEAKEAGEDIEIVDVFRRPEDVPPIAEEAIKIGAMVLWLQLGIRNDEAAQKARQAGLTVVQPLDGARLVHVFNKMDQVSEPAVFRRLAAARYPRAVFTAAARDDVGELRGVLEGREPSGAR